MVEAPVLFKEPLPGDPGQACVAVNPLLDEVGRADAIRSGDFVAGTFNSGDLAPARCLCSRLRLL
jgi:hypothetical protein